MLDHRVIVKAMSKSQGRKKKCKLPNSSVTAALPEETQHENLHDLMERKFSSREERVSTKECIANILTII